MKLSIINIYHRKIRKFFSAINTSRLIVLLAFVFVLLYGAIGVYCLRGQFNGIHSVHDAIYYTVVTFSTLGDNAMTPLTMTSKYFVVSMVVFGFSIFAMFFTVVVYQVVENLNQMLTRYKGEKIHMKDHVILCGYSVLTELLIMQLLKKNIPFILLDSVLHPELNAKEGGNFLFVQFANKQDSLITANIEFCKAVLAISDSDSENILASMNAASLKKKYNATFKIVTRVLHEEHIEIAKNSGSTDVISPTLMAAKAIMTLLSDN